MALHSPYATTLWDYINRGMPFSKEGSLKPDEVYAVTAFLLFKNGVIKEDDVLDAQSLPQVKMPNHDAYALPVEAWSAQNFYKQALAAVSRSGFLRYHTDRNSSLRDHAKL